MPLHEGVPASLRREIAALVDEAARRRWPEMTFLRRARSLIEKTEAGANESAVIEAFAVRLFTERGGEGAGAASDPVLCADGGPSPSPARNGVAHHHHGRPHANPMPLPPAPRPSEAPSLQPGWEGDHGSPPDGAAAPENGEALAAAYETCARMCLVDGRIDRDCLDAEATGIADAFRRPVDRVRQGIEEACRRMAGATEAEADASADDNREEGAPARREWTDLAPGEQERIVAAVAAAAQNQHVTAKRSVLALVRGAALRECPDLRYSGDVGDLIAERVAQRLKSATESAAQGRPVIPVPSWFHLSEQDRAKLLSAAEERAGRGAGRSDARLALDEAAAALGWLLTAKAKDAACAAFAQRCREAAAADDQAARERARPAIDLACAQAADTLRAVLREAAGAAAQELWPNPALAALAAIQDAATAAWQALPGHLTDQRPPHAEIARIMEHPALAPLAEHLEATFGPRWQKALGGKALRDLLPGCPVDLVLDEDCPWHVQPDGSVTKTVLGDDGQGGKTLKEQQVLPTVILPLEQEWRLPPWGLPSSGEEMVGHTYGWWRRNADGGGKWLVGSQKASVLFDAHRMTALADAGVPIDSETSSEYLSLMRYVRDLPAGTKRRPVFTQTGWYELPDGRLAFALGHQVILADGEERGGLASASSLEEGATWQQALDPGTRQTLAAYRRRGDRDTSVGLFLGIVRRYPRVAAMAGMAYSALLLSFLHDAGASDMAGYVVECTSDTTSVGKSAAQKAVLSLGGSPLELLNSFWRTGVSTGTLLAAAHCLPLGMEESQMAEMNVAGTEREGAALASLVYAVSKGVDRGRGAAAGGNRETKHFRTVMFITAERSVLAYRVKYQGEETRVIHIGLPFGAPDPATGSWVTRVVEPTVCQHYGHVIPEVVRSLLQRARDLGGFDQLGSALVPELEAEKQRVAALWTATGDPEVDSRLGRFSKQVGAGMMTLRLILRCCGLPEREVDAIAAGARRALMEDNSPALSRDTNAQRHLDALREILATHSARIAGLEPVDRAGERRVPAQGYIGGLANIHRDGQVLRVIALLPDALDEKMAEAIGAAYNQQGFVQAMQRAGAWVGDPEKPNAKALAKYSRADGQAIRARHYCLLVDKVWLDGQGPKPGESGGSAGS